MRRRGLMAVPVLLVSLALGAPAASADDGLKMYRITVDDEKVAMLGDLGVDLGHTGYDRSVDRAQTIFVDLIDAQARKARAEGLVLEEEVPGPHVSETQIANKIAASKRASGRRPPSPRPAATRRTRSTTCSAPTPSPAASRTR